MTAARSNENEPTGGLLRLWIEFDFEAHFGLRPGQAIGITGDARAVMYGCGVSGYDEDDCLDLAEEQVFHGRPLPPIRRLVPNVDVSTLAAEVQQALGVAVRRGVWFPVSTST